MSEAGHTNSSTGAKEGTYRWRNDTDPICLAIERFRAGFADYNANAPSDDEAARIYADRTFRPHRRVIVNWSEAARTREGAVAALRLAREADENDDHAVVGPMVQAALAYFEASA